MSNLDAALELLRSGKPVFPVDRATKKPLIKWEVYQHRLPIEDEVKACWRERLDANIGVVTGHLSGIAVIDCDSEDVAKRFIEAYTEAQSTLQVQTGRGRHFYFKWEEGIRNSAGALGPDIDVRGEGGFVIVPPSIHANGHAYEWLNKNEPQPLPEKLKAKLLSKEADNGAQAETEAERIPEGKRNDTLTSLAGTMRRRGMTAKAIEAALQVENALRCDPPLSENDVKTIAESVSRYEPSIPSPIGGDVMDGIIWAKDVSPPGKGEEIKTLWGPFIYPSSLHLLAGDAGVGKTTLGYNLAVQLARGEDFVGFGPPRPLRVLYYDLETPQLLFREKLHRISNSDLPEGLAFARPFSVDAAKKLTQEHGFDLIIVDTGNEAFGTQEEEDNAEANRQMQQLRGLIQETGVAILLFYHMAKDPSQKGVYKLRGASARPAAADVVLNVEPARTAGAPSNGGGTNFVEVIKLEVAKNRWGEKAYLTLKKVGEDRFEVNEASGAHTATQEALAESFILTALPLEPEVIETKEILQLGSQKGISQPTLERVLKKLSQAGQILKPSRGAYCLPSNHPSPQGYRVDGIDGREGSGKGDLWPTPLEWREADHWPTSWV